MTSVNNRPEILSKLGVGSGLDTSALIETLVEAEIAGPKEQLEKRESDLAFAINKEQGTVLRDVFICFFNDNF